MKCWIRVIARVGKRQSERGLLVVISLCRREKASSCTKHYKEIEANDSPLLRPKAFARKAVPGNTWKRRR